MTIDLAALLTGQVFAFMMIFCRVGAAIMLFPGIGEPYVPPRSRMVIASALTLLLLPLLADKIPPQPAGISGTAKLIASEVCIGLFFGTMLRFLLSALEMAGHFVAFQTALANATMFNPAFATQGTLPGALLSSVAILLLFSSGLEGILLEGVVRTYDVFTPGSPLMVQDMAQVLARLLPKAFLISVQMAAPFFLIGLLVFVPVGIMNKLMPQLQVFMVMMPMQVGVGLLLFMVSLPLMLMFWLEQFDDAIHSLLMR